MNYKIKITEENHTIVKRIADENGMNPKELNFNNLTCNYYIENNIFRFNLDLDGQELTTEQFIEMFDKRKETTELGLLKIELNHTKTLLTSCENALASRDNFKSKVINLMEFKRNNYIIQLKINANNCEFHTAGNFKLLAKEMDLLISKIKKL